MADEELVDDPAVETAPVEGGAEAAPEPRRASSTKPAAPCTNPNIDQIINDTMEILRAQIKMQDRMLKFLAAMSFALTDMATFTSTKLPTSERKLNAFLVNSHPQLLRYQCANVQQYPEYMLYLYLFDPFSRTKIEQEDFPKTEERHLHEVATRVRANWFQEAIMVYHINRLTKQIDEALVRHVTSVFTVNLMWARWVDTLQNHSDSIKRWARDVIYGIFTDVNYLKIQKSLSERVKERMEQMEKEDEENDPFKKRKPIRI